MTVNLSHSTRSRRRKSNIPLDLPVHYRQIWLDRIPNITQMIQHRIPFRLIAKHYGVTLSAFGMSMKYHGISANRIRYELIKQ